MKRVLQISNYLYPHIGGIEQVARDIADSLADKLDIEQKIICFNEDAQDGSYINYRNETVHEKVDGIDVIRCGCFAKVASQSLSMTYKRELKKLFTEFKPDIVIFHYPNPFVASLMLPMLPKESKLVLWWSLDITKQKIFGKLFYRQNIKLLDRAECVVAETPLNVTGSPWLNRYKDKCKVIADCIRPERFEDNEHTYEKVNAIKAEYKGKTICFAVGRHVPYKGMRYLVEASKKLDDSFVVLIGGQGELTEDLKREANGDSKVIFLGKIPQNDMAAYYKACDIFCFPSITKNEAFGIALVEAMYFGKPAVTFHIPGSGVNYVSLNGETGIECPNGDFKAFANAIMALGEDKKLRDDYGNNARERVRQLFLYDTFRKNVKELIRDL